jgi:hypothetical protein
MSSSDGRFAFAGLLAGSYTLVAADAQKTVTVDGRHEKVVSLRISWSQPPTPKVIPLYILLDPHRGRMYLRLARRYLLSARPAVGFSTDEAMHAQSVIIVADGKAVSPSDEERLRASGCTVARLDGDPYMVEEALAHLAEKPQRAESSLRMQHQDGP